MRDDLTKLRRVLVATPGGAQVPLEELAELKFVDGPGLIKSEAAQLIGYVYVDVAGRDLGSYLADGRDAVARAVKLPPGYILEWSGSYEGMQRATRILTYVIPITLVIIFVLLYLNARSLAKVLIVLTAVPFSLVGAFLLLWLLGYHLSVAVWVGIIALAGVDAETGMVMLLYLDVAYDRLETRRSHDEPGRARWRRHGRRRPARAAQDDDGHGDPDGPAADHVVQRHRRGRNETHRRPDGGRDRDQLHPGAADLPGHLHVMEMVVRRAASAGGAQTRRVNGLRAFRGPLL